MIAAKESLLDLCRLMDSDRSGSLPSCDEGSVLRVQDLRFSGFMGLGFGAPRVLESEIKNPGAVLQFCMIQSWMGHSRLMETYAS